MGIVEVHGLFLSILKFLLEQFIISHGMKV